MSNQRYHSEIPIYNIPGIMEYLPDILPFTKLFTFSEEDGTAKQADVQCSIVFIYMARVSNVKQYIYVKIAVSI